jgi:hypothetical protein
LAPGRVSVHLGFGRPPLLRPLLKDLVDLPLVHDADVVQVLDDHGTLLVGVVVQPATKFNCKWPGLVFTRTYYDHYLGWGCRYMTAQRAF